MPVLSQENCAEGDDVSSLLGRRARALTWRQREGRGAEGAACPRCGLWREVRINWVFE
jgi:hypothetical protein